MVIRDGVADITIPIRATQELPRNNSDRLSLNLEDVRGRIWQRVVINVVYVDTDPYVYDGPDKLSAGLWGWDSDGRAVLAKAFSGGYLEADIRFTRDLRDSDGASVMRVYCDGVQITEHVYLDPEPTAVRLWAYFFSAPFGWYGNDASWVSAPSARIGTIRSRGAARDWLKFEKWLNQQSAGFINYAAYRRPKDVVTDLFGLIGTRYVADVRLDGLVDIDDEGYIYVKGYDGPNYNKEYVDPSGNVTRQLDRNLQLRMLGTTGSGDGPHAVLDHAGRTKLAYADITFQDMGYAKIMFQRIEEFHDATSWSDPVAILNESSAPYAPCLVSYADGTIVCWYMDGVTQHASRSKDDGRTWTELTNMLGANLTNVYCLGSSPQGTTYGVGLRDNQAYFVYSTDHGLTQARLPGGAIEQLIGTVGYDTRPCLTFEPTGELVCWAQDDDGERVEFSNRNKGVGPWTQRV